MDKIKILLKLLDGMKPNVRGSDEFIEAYNEGYWLAIAEVRVLLRMLEEDE